MANATSKLQILIDVITGNSSQKVSKLENDMKAAEKITKALNAALNALAVAGVVALGKFTLDSIKKASNMNETLSKTKIVLGEASGAVLDYAKNTAASFGLSEQAALDAASTFAIFGKSAGLSGAALSDFSLDLTSLASDLASFHNAAPEEVVLALGAALRGESEPMRRFGVLLDDATMRQKALEMGIISTTKNALTPQQRVLAAQALIFEQTSDAQGDFARTSDGLANQTRILQAQLENLSATMGTGFLPVAIQVISALNDMASDTIAFGITQEDLLQATRKHIITLADYRYILGQVRMRKMSDAEAADWLAKKYAEVSIEIEDTTGYLIEERRALQLSTKYTEELSQSSEDLAKTLQEDLQKGLKELQGFINGTLGPSYDDFIDKQDDVKDRMAEVDDKFDETREKMEKIAGQIDFLNQKQHLTDKQKNELEDLQEEYKNLGEELTEIGDDYSDLQTQYAENANAHDEATKRILLDLLTQRAAMDGLTQDELAMITSIAEQWGLIDEATVRATQAADQALSDLANGAGIRDAIDMMNILRNQTDGMYATLKALDGRTFSYNVKGEYSSTGNVDPHSGQYYGRAGGGPVMPGQTYTVGEQGPETLVMGKSGGYVIPNTTNNWNLTINEAGRTVNPMGAFAMMRAIAR